MSINISYKKNLPKNKLSNLVFFVNEKYSIQGLKKNFNTSEIKFIEDVLKSQNLSKKIISLDLSSKKKFF